MLVLTRKKNEVVRLVTSDGEILVTYLETKGNGVRLGFTAPGSVAILRGELKRQPLKSPATSQGK